MSPALARPLDQSQRVPPVRITGSAPAMAISVARNIAAARPKETAASRRPRIAPRAARSSWSAWANSFTVLMLVIVSTTCPVTIARAAALFLDLIRMRGRNQRIAAK